MRSPRLPGESDEDFLRRAERAAVYARVLSQAALANRDIQSFISDPELPHNEERERSNPTVRVEYEQAYAVAAIGEGLSATRNKHWGEGPQILPLEPDDPVDPWRVLYVFKENSVYNRRFLQRQRLKELLGRRYRPLVEKAKYKRHTKKIFLQQLTEEQAAAIRTLIGVEPGEFWRMCRGRLFRPLPEREEQTYFDFMVDDTC